LINAAQYLLLEKRGDIVIFVHKHATNHGILMAFFHALLLLMVGEQIKDGQRDGCKWMDEHYPIFISQVLFCFLGYMFSALKSRNKIFVFYMQVLLCRPLLFLELSLFHYFGMCIIY
jgi:hypothetical protein